MPHVEAMQCNPPKVCDTTPRSIVASFFERSSNGRSFFMPFKGCPKIGRPYGYTVPLPCDAVPDRQRCHKNTRYSVAIWVKFGFLCVGWGIVRAREENGKFADILPDNARKDRPHQTVLKCVCKYRISITEPEPKGKGTARGRC